MTRTNSAAHERCSTGRRRRSPPTPTTPSGVWPTRRGARSPFGYAGQYTDPETGFQYLQARYYDLATGQFLTRDPLVELNAVRYTQYTWHAVTRDSAAPPASGSPVDTPRRWRRLGSPCSPRGGTARG